MAVLRLFAGAREAAGTGRDLVPGATVAEVLAAAVDRYGDGFAAVLATCRVWLNGEPADPADRVAENDEVAVLPPVSGGAAELPADETAAPEPQGPPPPKDADLDAPDAPHVRLGLLWIVLTVGAAVAPQLVFALWLAAIAAVGAYQLCRGWIAQGERPVLVLAALAAAGLPLAAVEGPGAMTGVVVALLAASLVVRMLRPDGGAPLLGVGLTVFAGAVMGIAAAGPVLVRELGLTETLLLLALLAAYDAGSYLVGTGAANRWEGPAAGIVCMVPVTLFAATGLVGVLRGATPWVLAGIAAALAPLGPLAGSVIETSAKRRCWAVGRLDVLFVLSPIWSYSALALLD